MIDMTRRLLLLLWLGFTVSGEVKIQKRIIGGHDCPDNERRYHVKLITLDSNGNGGLCGGSLITERWILTAAHCWKQGWTISAYVGVHPGPAQIFQILSEPRIYKDSSNRQHDIMVLELPYAANIPPVALPDCANPPQLLNTVSVAGYGSTKVDSSNEKVPGQAASLQCGELKVADCTDHRNAMQANTNLWSYMHYQTLFCGSSTAVDICPGESGGGVLFNNMIYGVISTLNPTLTCVHGGGFIKLCHPEYITWIRQFTQPHTIAP